MAKDPQSKLQAHPVLKFTAIPFVSQQLYQQLCQLWQTLSLSKGLCPHGRGKSTYEAVAEASFGEEGGGREDYLEGSMGEIGCILKCSFKVG